jgi:hypothetical protein
MTQQEIRDLLGRLTITPDELHQSGILPLGRNGIYEAIKRGDLAAIEIGKKKAIITAPLRKRLGMDA